jgi:hypothetical protein
MVKRAFITVFVFVLVGAVAFGAAALAAPAQVALPQVITADTPCPVAGCTQPDGLCHAAAVPPEADGSFEMLCPRAAGCTDTTCHAQERLTGHYNRPSDMSMNLWILAPVVLIVGLVLLVRKL